MNRRNFIRNAIRAGVVVGMPNLLLRAASPQFLNPGFFSEPPASGAAADTNPALVTAQTPGSTRHDVTGELGFSFTVGGSGITVTSLGRYILSGNAQSHLIVIRNDSCGSIVVSATVNAALGTVGTYSFVSCTPTFLAAGAWRVLTTENSANASELWYDVCPITTTADVSTVAGAYFISPTCGASSGGNSYGIPNLKYRVGA